MEGVYVPAGMIFAERVYKEESFGVRFRVLAPSDERGVRDLEAIAEIVQKAGQPITIYTEVVTYLKARRPAPQALAGPVRPQKNDH